MRRFRAWWATSWSRCATSAEPTPRAPIAFVALGANLGDPASSFVKALSALAALGAVDAASSVWATAAVGGPPDQPEYLNAVVRWRPAPAWASPDRALAALLAVEAGLGRRRLERWGPRTLDLDLLDGDGWSATARGGRAIAPTLPHPRAAERAFVLVPWAEVAPEWPAPPPAAANGGVAPPSAPRGGRPSFTTVEARMRSVDRSGVRPASAADAAAWRAAVARVRAPGPAHERPRDRG
jgi:2-amino-4-hydroxy-6-hydroxymethyldihydropteridine diphosphokinase